jgi:hypothetical protein
MRSSDRTSALTLMWSTSAWRKRRDAANSSRRSAATTPISSVLMVGARTQVPQLAQAGDRKLTASGGLLRRYAAYGPWPVPALAIGLSRRVARVRRAHRRNRRGRGAGRRGCGVGSMVRPAPRCRSAFNVYPRNARVPDDFRRCTAGRHIERLAGELSRALFDGRHDVRAVV